MEALAIFFLSFFFSAPQKRKAVFFHFVFGDTPNVFHCFHYIYPWSVR